MLIQFETILEEIQRCHTNLKKNNNSLMEEVKDCFNYQVIGSNLTTNLKDLKKCNFSDRYDQIYYCEII
jgi:pyruvate/oxaloacetate carboxyltransferase